MRLRLRLRLGLALILALCLFTAPASASLLFNGTTDVVTGPTYTHGTTQYTITCWGFANTLGELSFGSILTHGALAATTGRIGFFLNNGTNVNSLDVSSFWTTTGQWISPANSIVLSTWQHYATTYDGSAATNDGALWINGVSQTITQVGANPTGSLPTDTRVVYGGNAAALNQTYDGKLGELAVWNRLLSQTEVSAVYILGVLAVPNGLTIYWPMSGSVANANDLSGNNQDGTLTGTALDTDPPSGQRRSIYYISRYRAPTLSEWIDGRLTRFFRGLGWVAYA